MTKARNIRGTGLIDEGSIYILVAAPIIWAAHFLLCYWVVAIWCAKFGESLVTPRTIVLVLTAVALAGIGWVVWKAVSRYDGTFVIHEEMTKNTDEERKKFLGHVALLLAGLSAVAVVFTAIPALVFSTC